MKQPPLNKVFLTRESDGAFWLYVQYTTYTTKGEGSVFRRSLCRVWHVKEYLDSGIKFFQTVKGMTLEAPTPCPL